MAWIWIILAVVYMLSPYDLIPDFFPIRGWLDDLVVLFLLVRYVLRLNRRRSAGYQYEQAYEQTQNEKRSRPDQNESAQSKDPYTILGISHQAGQDEIRGAYLKLVNQYHPDKVAHLGNEFQELAEKRFKEIQNAYDQLRK